MRKTFIAAALLCLSALCARAQFFTHGSDPSNLRWYSTETPYYKLIYPEGADSLARVYGRLLEQFREPIGHSAGTTPGAILKKMPVVLHTHNPYSNGSVGWAPKRMDMFTVPEPYGADPVPWEVQLTAHEPRHQAQMQYAYGGWFKYGTWLIGDGFSPLVWALYLDWAMGEGDAVVAETGLTTGTRARTADFLNYFRVAYDNGDWRTWNRWRYGSFKYYAPDHYRIGYMTVAGARVFGENPMVVPNAIDKSLKKPWVVAPYNIKARKNYRQYAEKFNAIWQEEDAARAPFMPGERVSAKEAFPVFYSGIAAAGGTLYMVRKGFTHNTELVSWKDGVWTTIMPFASHTSSLHADEEHARLYWTETLPDKRWDLEGRSIVRYYDIIRDDVVDLTKEGRLYNPATSPDGLRIAVAEYPVEGGSASVVLSANDGLVLERHTAPSGIQITEQAWIDDALYALCLEEGGYSIRLAGSWDLVFGPVPAKMCDLGSDGDRLEFVSDASGVNELYLYRPGEADMEQVSCTRYGATDFCADGSYLYYVSTVLDGQALMRTPLDAQASRVVPASSAHAYPVEDVLTAQENAMGGVDRSLDVQFTPPVRYHKLPHLMKFHTWLPAYVNYDAIESASFDLDYEDISLGATLFFQNDLGTMSGSLGYALHPDPDVDKAWRNAFHAKLTYTGLYPVIEGYLDLGDHASRLYKLADYHAFGRMSTSAVKSILDYPVVTATVRSYVPLSFSKGGVLYGVTPQVRYSVSNNVFSTARLVFKAPEDFFEGLPAHYVFSGFKKGENKIFHSASASLRGYVMLPRPHSRVYPKWGIGAEVGGMMRFGLADLFAPNLYGYAYAYAPGLYQTHGLRLTALVQKQLWNNGTVFGDVTVNTAPRGFNGSASSTIAAGENTSQWKITADYAIPFTIGGDLSLMPVAYIRNFVLTPHFDYTGLSGGGNLWSAGADFAADMGYLLLVAADLKLGVSFSLLGGTWFSQSGQKDTWYLGPVFDFSF